MAKQGHINDEHVYALWRAEEPLQTYNLVDDGPYGYDVPRQGYPPVVAGKIGTARETGPGIYFKSLYTGIWYDKKWGGLADFSWEALLGDVWTMEAWLYMENTGTKDSFFCRKYPTTTNNASYNGIEIFVDTDDMLKVWYEYSNGLEVLVSSGFIVDKLTWTHIAVSQEIETDGTATFKFYLDGIYKTKSTGNTAPAPGRYGLVHVGYGYDGVSETYFDGHLDDICFSSKARSVYEIYETYQRGMDSALPILLNEPVDIQPAVFDIVKASDLNTLGTFREELSDAMLLEHDAEGCHGDLISLGWGSMVQLVEIGTGNTYLFPGSSPELYGLSFTNLGDDTIRVNLPFTMTNANYRVLLSLRGGDPGFINVKVGSRTTTTFIVESFNTGLEPVKTIRDFHFVLYGVKA